MSTSAGLKGKDRSCLLRWLKAMKWIQDLGKKMSIKDAHLSVKKWWSDNIPNASRSNVQNNEHVIFLFYVC